jgi:hypothetical protein
MIAAKSWKLVNEAELFAEDYLRKHSLRPERFSKQEMRAGKTPDYRVFRDIGLVAYCEVKHLQRDDWAGGLRSDPIFNRISNHIHEAAQQFEAVNPDHAYPNILVFANSGSMSDSRDLDSVITGLFHVKDATDEAIDAQFSEGRIKEEKSQIDLYIWWDTWKDNDRFSRYFLKESVYKDRLRELLPRSGR